MVRRHLHFSPKRKTLICGVNDLAVLGALRAFAEVGRSEYCLALGVGAFPEARRELRSPQTRLIGSIATFPERYGDNLIQIALDILHRNRFPLRSMRLFSLSLRKISKVLSSHLICQSRQGSLVSPLGAGAHLHQCRSPLSAFGNTKWLFRDRNASVSTLAESPPHKYCDKRKLIRLHLRHCSPESAGLLVFEFDQSALTDEARE